MTPGSLGAALCLVLVIEGLALFVAPQAWKRLMAQLQHMDAGTLRLAGGIMVAVGLLALRIVS